MLLNIRENEETEYSDRAVIGYDLGEGVSQISFCPLNQYDAETVSTVAGSQMYNIPTVLCKRNEVNQWYFGRDAIKKADDGEGVLIDGLVEKARAGLPVVIEDDEFEPIPLLTLFVKRSLSVLSTVVPLSKIAGIMFTTGNMDETMVDIFSQVVVALGLKTNKIYFQSHVESYYFYMIHQPRDLWNAQVLLCDYEKENLTLHRMEFNRNTTPVVAYTETTEFGSLGSGNRDNVFLSVLKKECEGRRISSVHLFGDGFKEEWYKESLRFLCGGRRVFLGNNLYSKGACYGMLEKLNPSEEGKSHVFLGKDKLKSNVGMQVLRQGEDSYLALLDAGKSWYEIKAQYEVILEEGNELTLIVTPLTGKNPAEVVLTLDGLKERPMGTTRLSISFYMVSESHLKVVVEDLGFGEFFPASHLTWEHEIIV